MKATKMKAKVIDCPTCEGIGVNTKIKSMMPISCDHCFGSGKINKPTEREVIFNKYDGNCAYCGEPLGKVWHVDHFLPVVRSPFNGEKLFPERDNLDNKFPACPSCNNYKSSHSIAEFRRLIGDLKNQLKRTSQYRIALRYGLILETDNEVTFHFENQITVK